MFCCFGCCFWFPVFCERIVTAAGLVQVPYQFTFAAPQHMAAMRVHLLADLPVPCNMQLDVLNDLAKAKRRWTEKNCWHWGGYRYYKICFCWDRPMEQLLELWKAQIGEYIIWQIELYVMVLIRWQFQELLRNRRSVWWVDNDAARYCAIIFFSVQRLHGSCQVVQHVRLHVAN